LDQIQNGDVDVSYGVHLAIDGMPTGVRIDQWDKGGAYLKRYFVVVDAALDISNQLDPGRKGISRYYASQISDRAQDLLSNARIGDSDSFSRYAVRYLDHGHGGRQPIDLPEEFQARVTTAREQGSEQESHFPALLSLLRAHSSLEYFPSDEQGVIALFFELLNQRVLKGYRAVYLAGSRAVYDAALEYSLECTSENVHPTDPLGAGQAFVDQLRRGTGRLRYEHRNHYAGLSALPELCVDFKRTIGDFLDEVIVKSSKSSKDPNMLNMLVAWDDIVPNYIDSAAYQLIAVDDRYRRYHGTTHRLRLTREYNTEISCIVLRAVLQRIQQAGNPESV